jgi:UDP-N-acetylmuramate dehydrogenase
VRPEFIKEKESLKSYNTWRVGGEAEYLCLPSNVSEAVEAIKWAEESDVPVTYLGSGSNVLISDRGVKGLVLCTKKINFIEDESDQESFRLRCGAGALKLKVMRRFLKEGLPPALFLSGLPGDVAAGVVMNAGVSEKEVHPKEFVEIVESFKVLERKDSSWTEKYYNNSDVSWSYRSTKNWGPGLITEVTLSWPIKDKVEGLSEKVQKAQALRKSKQPLELPSCGSVFTNPYDDPKNVEKRSAGFLIEKAGLKGYEYGGAEISRKHANFIVNKGDATALDLHCAIALAQEKVKHIFDIKLHTEVRYIGDWEGLI